MTETYNNPFKIKIPVSQKSLEKNQESSVSDKTAEDAAVEEEVIKTKKKERKEELAYDDFPKLKGIHILLPPALHKDYKKHCVEKGISIKDDIVFLIKNELKKK